MIELSKPIVTKDGVLVPAGTPLDFKNGKAKYQGRTIDRALVPLQCIKGTAGPFLNVCCATVLNDNRGFQQTYDKKFQDWAHCVIFGDYLIVYVWDTRQVIDIIPGIHQATKGGPIVKRLVNPKTGETIVKTIGHAKWGWAKSLYEMMMWPQYARMDNGLPLKTDEPGWKQIIDDFNRPIKVKYAYEAYDEAQRAEMAKNGEALPDGSYPIANVDDLQNAIQAYGRAKDKNACKWHIVKRAIDLDRPDMIPAQWIVEDKDVADEMRRRGVDEKFITSFESMTATEQVVGRRGAEIMAFRYDSGLQSMLRQMKLRNCKSEPWLHLAVSVHTKTPCYAIYIWDTRKVLEQGELTREQAMKIIHACWQTKNSAIDNNRKLDGGGSAVSMLNQCFALEADAADMKIEPAEGIANTHLILLKNGDAYTQVGKIFSNDLTTLEPGKYLGKDLASDEEKKDKADDAFEDVVVDEQSYRNTDHELLIQDNNGKVVELDCLANPTVPKSVLLSEYAKTLQ